MYSMKAYLHVISYQSDIVAIYSGIPITPYQFHIQRFYRVNYTFLHIPSYLSLDYSILHFQLLLTHPVQYAIHIISASNNYFTFSPFFRQYYHQHLLMLFISPLYASPLLKKGKEPTQYWTPPFPPLATIVSNSVLPIS